MSLDVSLDDRKTKILQAIVRNYLETGEPVGSRTISKYTDLNLSSATIRNEMADLEELGFILQPHTSSGRIPSDKGYRLYVDIMMEEKAAEVEQMREVLLKKEERLDQLLKQTAKLLAVNTNYATMVSAPVGSGSRLKFVQLSRVDKHQLLIVVVSEGNVIKNNIIGIDDIITDETLLKLNILVNTHLSGMPISDIKLSTIMALKKQAGIHGEIMADVIESIAQSIKEEEDLEVYTSGANNIFRYPELADNHSASELISTLEEKQSLSRLITDKLNEGSETGIQVYIGNENTIPSMKDCSVVTANYEIGDGLRGTIGIIGPKRMDYDKVVDNLKQVMKQLDIVYKE